MSLHICGRTMQLQYFQQFVSLFSWHSLVCLTAFWGTLRKVNYVTGILLTLKVLVATIDAQFEGMGDVGSARYEPALLPPCPTVRVLNYSN